MRDYFEEHNKNVRELSLASNIKMRYLLYSNNIRNLEERKQTVMRAKILELNKQTSLGWEIIVLGQLTQELMDIKAELDVNYALFHSMEWLIDNFNLWENTDNAREELESLIRH